MLDPETENVSSSIPENIRSTCYPTYYPGQIIATDSDILVECPFGNCGITLTINKDGAYSCSNCKANGEITDFMKKLEGIDIHGLKTHFQLLNSPKNILGIDNIKKWNTQLFSPDSKNVLDYLVNERGCDVNNLKNRLIGYDENKKKLVVPIINATGQGIAGMMTLKLSESMNLELDRVVGGARIFGYKEFLRSNDAEPIIVTTDPIDAMVLENKGYQVIALFDGFEGWNDNLANQFFDNDVVLLVGNKTPEFRPALKVARSILEFCSSLVVMKTDGLPSISEYFAKQNKSKSDFDKIVGAIRKLNKKNIDLIETYEKELAEEIKVSTIHPSQDYLNGVFYYGVKSGNKESLIDSKGTCKSFEEINKEGSIKFEPDELAEFQFSATGITSYLMGSSAISANMIFTIIREYIKRYVFFEEQSIYTTLSLWVVGTYVHRIFRHFPYIHINAERGSGKSHLLEVLRPIAFNGKISSHITGAALFRTVHSSAPTLFLDEVEKLGTQERSSYMSILNSGYAKSGKVDRYEQRTKKLKPFNTYSPKMFAGIENLSDTLSDRSIMIQIRRKLSTEHVANYRDNEQTQKQQADMRDNLYLFGLTYGPQIGNLYEKDFDTLEYLKGLNTRRADVWSPLLIIADIIDKSRGDSQQTVLDEAKHFLTQDIEMHKVVDSEESNTLILITAILDALKILFPAKREGTVQWIITNDLFNHFKSQKEVKHLNTQSKLTRALRKLSIACETKNLGKDKSARCYGIDRDNLIETGKRYGLEIESGSTTQSISNETHNELFKPLRVIVTPSAKEYPRTNEIIKRLKEASNDIEFSESVDGNPILPQTLIDDKDIHQYLRQTVVLGARSGEYFETFPSPGDIIEEMNTMCRISYQCPSDCEYCYLQFAGGGATIRWRRWFVDIDRIEKEFEAEILVHKTMLTLWSATSFILKRPLGKVYISGVKNTKTLFEVGEEIRKYFLRTDSTIKTDKDAKQYLKQTIHTWMTKMGIGVELGSISNLEKAVTGLYEENIKMPLWINIGEYSDVFAIDSYTHYMDHFHGLIQKQKELKVAVYTKTPNVDSILEKNWDRRLKIIINMNTNHIINKYERDVFSLDARFDAIKKVLDQGSILVKLTIEPIIKYDGYIKDYVELAQRINSEIDMENRNLLNIKFGGVRYRKDLATQIKRNHPGTDLLDDVHGLVDPEGTDGRLRYSEDDRIEIYTHLIQAFNGHKEKLGLGCEKVGIWEKLGLDWESYIGQNVYQYGENTKNQYDLG